MIKKVPPHVQLPVIVPPRLPDPKPEIIAELTYEINPLNPKQALFKFNVEYRHHKPIVMPSLPLSFLIFRDCKVTLKLNKSIGWRWSEDYFEITTKANYGTLYGNLTRVDDHVIHFIATYNSTSEHPNEQKINLNIDYLQAKRWLPITIDPAIGNPRPPADLPVGIKDEVLESQSFTTILSGTIEES